MDAIKLFQMVRADIRVDIEIRFEGEALVVEGYDIGETVEKFFGDSDYEYNTRISPDGVNRLFEYFGVWAGDRQGLLKAIAARYHSNTCYSEFQKLLDDLKIKYESWSWR